MNTVKEKRGERRRVERRKKKKKRLCNKVIKIK